MNKAALGQRTSLGMLRRITGTISLTLILALASSAMAGAGYLGPGDEQLPGGEYFDRITFNGNTGDELLIELTSSEFDPYLIVIDSVGNTIAFQDDAAGIGLNVQLTVSLPATGQYTAIVTSALPGEAGSYLLSLAPADPQAAGIPASPAKPPAAPGQAAQTVSGTVLDTVGRPIEGARVMIVPAVTTGDIEVRTDSDGNYSVTDLPVVPYRARAWIYLDHGGNQVCLRLGMDSAADYDVFSPGMGAVKNFHWQLTGPIEDQRETLGTFGGTISLFNTWLYDETGNRVEFTFNPTGPLIDGSTGEAFTRLVDIGTDTYVRDVPVGPYILEATLVQADGTRLPMHLSFSEYGDAPTPSLNINWVGDGTCDLGNGWDWLNLYVWLP